MAVAEKEEIIYYELVKMEERITKKADLILKSKTEVESLLLKLEILFNKLEKKMDNLN